MEINNYSSMLPGFDVGVDRQYSGQQETAPGLARARQSAPIDGEIVAAGGSDDRALFREQFAAKASDPEAFHEFMEQVFGPDYDRAQAEQYRKAALAGDFSWLPEVRYVSSDSLGGANGAYDASEGVVYINEELQGTSLAAQTFMEEAGHHLDAKLNTVDSAGDEGELFRRMMSGEALSKSDIAAIRAENDQGTIVVDGKAIAVEFWNPFSAIADAAEAVGGAISDAASAVGGAISDAASAVGGAISDAASAVGGAISDAAGAVWGGISDAAGAVWGGISDVASTVWGGITDAAEWIAPRIADAAEGLFTGVVDGVVGIGRNLWESAKTFGGGVGKLFTGDFSGGLKDMGMGLVKLVQTPVDAVLLVGGRAISAIQTLVGLEPPGRELTDTEIDALREVYGDSIDYSKIRIKEGSAGLFSVSGRAFTHGNTIYIPEGDLPLSTDLLVHETAHVWQHQNGGTDYMSEALYSQYLGDGYDFQKGLDEGKSWSELNPEQQAEFLQQAYLSGYDFTEGSGDTFTYGGVDYTAQLEAALAEIRRGDGAP